MTAKEYLSQAFHLDQRINSKLEQIATLNDLATKCTSTITGMPHSQSKSTSTMEDAIVKILTLKNAINYDIAGLVAMKCEISTIIQEVDDNEYQMLLEKRYLCFKSWEEISNQMHYSLRWIHIMHSKALKAIDCMLIARRKINIAK